MEDQSRKARVLKSSRRGRIIPWYPASYEAVTLEEARTGGIATHIRPTRTTQKLFREFILSGRGIPTASQFESKIKGRRKV